MIEVRPAQAGDLDAICGVYNRVVAEERWLGTEPGYDFEERRERWKHQLESGTHGWFVAIDGGTIAGSLSVHRHEEYGLTVGMFVDAPFRGKGAGRALLDAAIAWARAQGEPHLSLLVFKHNEAAIRLYEKAGFIQREYYERDVTRRTGEVWDTILMVRDLR